MSLAQKPWSMDQFQNYRPHMTNFVDNDIVPHIHDIGCSKILVRAPVKSGKREMVEYIRLRDITPNGENNMRKHAYITAFHRTADKNQRKELEICGLEVFSIINKKIIDNLIKWIEDNLNDSYHIVLHLDECDHGSGYLQNLSKIWNHNRIHNNDLIKFILYSATPEEVIYSGEININDDERQVISEMRGGVVVKYEPPSGFCGPRRFLDNNLVTNAEPFFLRDNNGRYNLSNQALEIISGVRNEIEQESGRNIIALRLSYSIDIEGRCSKKDKKAIYQFIKNYAQFRELRDFVTIVDDNGSKFPNLPEETMLSQPINWSTKSFWTSKTENKPILLIFDQTSSRSTEWACHDRIFAMHDYRKNSNFTILSQAQERVNHYDTKYTSGFQPIRVYGSLKTFQLSAGYIDDCQYLSQGNNRPKIGISARVKGSVKKQPIINTRFIPCNNETFEEAFSEIKRNMGITQNIGNPFREDKKEGNLYMGCLRGYKVFTYEEVKKNSRWGFGNNNQLYRLTVCYRDNVCGVALRYDTGRFRINNTLVSHKSMYGENINI